MDHTILPSDNTIPAFTSYRHLADVATSNCCGRYLFPAYCSFTDPKRMKGWVGLVGRPIVIGSLT